MIQHLFVVSSFGQLSYIANPQFICRIRSKATSVFFRMSKRKSCFPLPNRNGLQLSCASAIHKTTRVLSLHICLLRIPD